MDSESEKYLIIHRLQSSQQICTLHVCFESLLSIVSNPYCQLSIKQLQDPCMLCFSKTRLITDMMDIEQKAYFMSVFVTFSFIAFIGLFMSFVLALVL